MYITIILCYRIQTPTQVLWSVCGDSTPSYRNPPLSVCCSMAIMPQMLTITNMMSTPHVSVWVSFFFCSALLGSYPHRLRATLQKNARMAKLKSTTVPALNKSIISVTKSCKLRGAANTTDSGSNTPLRATTP